MHIKLGPQRSLKPYPAQLEFSSIYGNENIPYVELWAVKQGTEEITFTNDQQKIPVQISLVMNKVKKQQNITITPNFKGADFPTIFHLLKIQKILSAEGNIKMKFLETGEDLNIPVPSLSFPPLDQDILDFIENICTIQNSMGIKIQPREDGFFTFNDKQVADELVSIIEKGNYKQNGLIFTIELKKAGIGKILEKREVGPLMDFLLTSDESSVEILTQKIELGPITQRVRGLWNMSLEEVRNWFSQAKEDDSLELKLEDVELFEEFENWKKQ